MIFRCARIGDYLRKYPGRRFLIVGKAPTRFEFENLASIEDPIIFINDAVQFEKFATRSVETFFFAHDAAQKVWITPEIKSTVVIPSGGASDSGADHPMLDMTQVLDNNLPPRIVTYEWGGWYGRNLRVHPRGEIARTGKLYLNSGTIHSAIHFAWLCGASGITFIGTDGFSNKYDERVELRSCSNPLGVFGKIRQVQDWECEQLGLETEYVNEPRIEPLIPRTIHFVWFGDKPRWVTDNIRQFRDLHKGWDVHLWTDLPDDMPFDLVKGAVDAEQYCSRSDILSYWLLHEYGGFYIDCDMIPLRSLEPLRRYEAFACVQHDGRVNCAAMGSVAGSRGFALVLQAVREVMKKGEEKKRTAYGPKLLTDLFGCDGERSTRHLSILPRHYFYLLVDQKSAHPFWRANRIERRRIAESNRKGITDSIPPYAMHLWGVDGSSKRKCFGRGDALGYRLREMAKGTDRIVGAEIGVLSGRLSEHILRAVPNLHLYMVDRWSAVDPDSRYARSGDAVGKMTQATMERNYGYAMEHTEFAADRRTVLRTESLDAAKQVADESLDFVFIDADHTYEGALEDLAAWYPKVRRGGLVSGHDMDNPAGGVRFNNPLWGVRRAVEEFMDANCPQAELELGGEYTWYFTKP